MEHRTGFTERLRKVRSLMQLKRLDGVLLRKRRSFSWLTGGGVNHIINTTELGVADLLIFPDKAYCIATRMESARIEQEEIDGMGFEMVTPEWYAGHDGAIEVLCRGKRIGSDVEPATIGLLAGVDISKELAELTYVLTEAEIERYRWLSQTAAKALEATCREIRPGMTEYEIQALLAYKVMREGINPQVILVATDERIYHYRHPLPSNKQLNEYAMVVLCAEKWGLVANATRFVHFGPLPPELKDNRLRLAEIDVAFNRATRPGVFIRDVFQAGIAAYQQAGQGNDWRYLHQGGPTGYASREFLATLDSEGVVQVNQAYAWNPAIRGIKSEDTLLVREKQNEFLTHTGEWEYIIIEKDGETYRRPDILVR